MTKFSPYIFSADARKQAEFYAKAFGGEIVDIKTFAEAPGAREEDKDRVMHLTLRIGDVIIYMADNGPTPIDRGNGMDLAVIFSSEAEGRVAFDNLAQDGKVIMPYERMFWGTTFGRVEDAFGVRWQISTEA